MDSRVKVNTQGDGTISPARMQEARCLFGADQQTENWKGNPGPLLQVKKRHGRILRWRAIPQGKVTAFSMATETYCCRCVILGNKEATTNAVSSAADISPECLL
ncbi:hypothetical protein NC651_025333 [Populus alba x Populus x berolinensis]|nr:hypothetical protein NC651_025333 [Populus alba x Populus x berolinensis]